MSFSTRRNKGSIFNVNTEGFEFIKLSELDDDIVYPIRGLHVFKTRYGYSPAAILDNCFVNLPKHMYDDVADILSTEEDIEDIKAGKVGIVKRKYTGKDGNQYIGCSWADIK